MVYGAGVGCGFQERKRFNSTDTAHRQTQRIDFTLVKSPDLVFSLEQINDDGAGQTGEEEGPRSAAEFAAPEMLGVPLFLPVRHDCRQGLAGAAGDGEDEVLVERELHTAQTNAGQSNTNNHTQRY